MQHMIDLMYEYFAKQKAALVDTNVDHCSTLGLYMQHKYTLQIKHQKRNSIVVPINFWQLFNNCCNCSICCCYTDNKKIKKN